MFGPSQKNMKSTTDSEIGYEDRIELSEPTQNQSESSKPARARVIESESLMNTPDLVESKKQKFLNNSLE